MDLERYMSQITRPYWSPVHPKNYITTRRNPAGTITREGWGIVYPDDIGSFNLMWLVSGCGQPPNEYKPYAKAVRYVLTISHFPISGLTLKHRAASCTLNEFQQHVERAGQPVFDALLDAVRLRV